MPYILCVNGPNIVVIGASCPQPSSSWSPPAKSCFGRHPSQYHSDSSQSFFSKPVHFRSRPSLSTCCLRTPQKSLIGWSYRTARGSISTPVGLKLKVSALVLFCLCSSSVQNSRRLTAASLTILPTKDLATVSALIFSASFIEVTPFLFQMVWRGVPLLFWHLYCSSSAFCLSFCRFSFLVSMHWHTR